MQVLAARGVSKRALFCTCHDHKHQRRQFSTIELLSGAGRNTLDISTDIVSDLVKLRYLHHYIKTQCIKLLIIGTYRKGRHQNLPE
ncbi:hypothetical protein A7S32_15950 [Salmonella enterica subsp. diarizonae serovar 59:[k]:z35]|nr:hypothetical protein A7S32_15950 [Salmonella enterica subsp. diarizonae serovar 59:[k]:z35]SUG59135.1 bacteriophage lysis protein [Salmonella enterica subsp. arizonae]